MCTKATEICPKTRILFGYRSPPARGSVYETLTCMPEALPYAAAAWVSVAASRIGRIAKAWMDETTPENGIRWAACNDRL